MSGTSYETRDLGSLTDSNYICPRDRKTLSHASLPAHFSLLLYQPQMPDNGGDFLACVMKQLAISQTPGNSEK